MSHAQEFKSISELVAELQVLSTLMYGASGEPGMLAELQQASASMRVESDRLVQLVTDAYRSTAERVIASEQAVEVILRSVEQVQLSLKSLADQQSVEEWGRAIEKEMAARLGGLVGEAVGGVANLVATETAERLTHNIRESMASTLQASVVLRQEEIVKEVAIIIRREQADERLDADYQRLKGSYQRQRLLLSAMTLFSAVTAGWVLRSFFVI